MRQRMHYIEGALLSATALLVLWLWLSGTLPYYVYPAYIPLIVASGFFMMLLSFGLWFYGGEDHFCCGEGVLGMSWTRWVILIPIILGVAVPPASLSSQTAFNRGVGNFVETFARHELPPFVIASKERSLISWIQEMQVDPEPSRYVGKEIKVQGFIVNNDEIPDDMLMVAKFVISCCAADARPVGLFVLKNTDYLLQDNQWYELEGSFVEGQVQGQRLPVVSLEKVTPIDPPSSPYEYL